MQAIFTFLYELFCGKNQEISDYRERIYGSVGMLTVLIALLIAVFFYVVLGRWKNLWYTRRHWGITLFVCIVIGFLLAYVLAKSVIGSVDGYLYAFALINGALLAVFFVLLSLLLKNFSIYSKRTPF